MNAIGQGEQYVSEDDIDHLAPPPGHLGPHARRSDLHCPDDGENSGDFGHDGSGGGEEEELMNIDDLGPPPPTHLEFTPEGGRGSGSWSGWGVGGRWGALGGPGDRRLTDTPPSSLYVIRHTHTHTLTRCPAEKHTRNNVSQSNRTTHRIAREGSKRLLEPCFFPLLCQ